MLRSADQFSDVDLIAIVKESGRSTRLIEVQGHVVEVFVYDVATAMTEIDNANDDHNPCLVLLMHLPLFDDACYSSTLRRSSFNRLFTKNSREVSDERSVAAQLHQTATTSISLVNANTLSRVMALERLANTGVLYFNYRNHRWMSKKLSHILWDLTVNFPDIARVYKALFSYDRISETDVSAFVLSVADENARGSFRPRAIDMAVLLNDSDSYNIYRRSDLTTDMLRCADRYVNQVDMNDLVHDRY